MDLFSVWSVLKWVLVVLAAGFIGQFGRVFATRLIERRHKKRAGQRADQPHDKLPPEVRLEEERLKAAAKLEKKRAKAEIKKAKKSRD
jgi:biopolymer transport protein ExbB/TolQ